MPIVPSRARRIHELLARLGSGKPAERDSAVAQLTLLGPRVVEPLLGALAGSAPAFRRAALDLLDRLRDPRALAEVLALAADPDPEVALAAITLAAEYPHPRTVRVLAGRLGAGPPEHRRAAARSLARVNAAGTAEALEPLLDALVDEDEDDTTRLVILDELAGIPTDARALRPVLKRLERSPDRAVALRARRLLRGSRPTPAAGVLSGILDRLADPGLRPEEAEPLAGALLRLGSLDAEALHGALDRARTPAAVRVLAEALGRSESPASIPALRRALERLGLAGGHEPRDEDGPRALAKAHVHAALAALDSRIALFDLRQMLASSPPRVAPLLLQAASAIGEASLVPALARLAVERPEHHEGCARAFLAIARRERLRRTSPALRGVRLQDREALEAFWALLRTRPGRGGRRTPR